MKKIVIAVLAFLMVMPLFAKVWTYEGIGKDHHNPKCFSMKCPVCQELVKSKQPEIAIRVIPGVREDDKGVYLVYRCMAGHTIKVYKQPE